LIQLTLFNKDRQTAKSITFFKESCYLPSTLSLVVKAAQNILPNKRYYFLMKSDSCKPRVSQHSDLCSRVIYTGLISSKTKKICMIFFNLNKSVIIFGVVDVINPYSLNLVIFIDYKHWAVSQTRGCAFMLTFYTMHGSTD
jgi:hypothetical protein